MHPESHAMVSRFVQECAQPLQRKLARELSVADVGAYDVNGTFRDLFGQGFAYTGLDIAQGPNVDRVVEMYDFGPVTYDIVISGNTLEHVFDMHRWRDAFIRLAVPGGLLCLTAPHSFPEHRFPVDCWRIFPDGMRWLFQELEILSCEKGPSDTCLIGRKRSDPQPPQ